MAPLHVELFALFGRATFMLPVGVALAGGLLVARRLRPEVRLPARRIAGVGAIAVVALVTENLLAAPGDGTGLVGDWLSHTLIDLFGGPITLMLLALLLMLGTGLAFELTLKWPSRWARQPDAEG